MLCIFGRNFAFRFQTFLPILFILHFSSSTYLSIGVISSVSVTHSFTVLASIIHFTFATGTRDGNYVVNVRLIVVVTAAIVIVVTVVVEEEVVLW